MGWIDQRRGAMSLAACPALKRTPSGREENEKHRTRPSDFVLFYFFPIEAPGHVGGVASLGSLCVGPVSVWISRHSPALLVGELWGYPPGRTR